MTEQTAAKRKNRISPRNAPEHTGTFETLTNDNSAAGFNNPRTDAEVKRPELVIAHSLLIVIEVFKFSRRLIANLTCLSLVVCNGFQDKIQSA